MDKMNKKSISKVVVACLVVLVVVQGFLIYALIMRNKNNEQNVTVSSDDIKLKPRIQNIRQNVVTQPTTVPKPQPLPKVTFNRNQIPSIKRQPVIRHGVSSPNQPVISRQGGMVKITIPNGGNPASVRVANMPNINIQARRINRMGVDPFDDIHKEFMRMQQRMNAMFNSNMGAMQFRMPQIAEDHLSADAMQPKLIEKNGDYIVKLKIPGLDKNNISVMAHNDILTVNGVQKIEKTLNSQYGSSFSSSIKSFFFFFMLPNPIKNKGIKTEYKKDLLTVIIPKL